MKFMSNHTRFARMCAENHDGFPDIPECLKRRTIPSEEEEHKAEESGFTSLEGDELCPFGSTSDTDGRTVDDEDNDDYAYDDADDDYVYTPDNEEDEDEEEEDDEDEEDIDSDFEHDLALSESLYLSDPDSYHSYALDLMKNRHFGHAISICHKGIANFPDSADLHADLIRAFHELGKHLLAEEEILELDELIPMQQWTWRCFSVCMDHLLLSPCTNESECRALLQAYKRHHPHEEMAYMAECDVELAYGHEDKAVAALQYAMDNCENAYICAYRLAGMQMRNAKYNDAIKSCEYGIDALFRPETNVDVLHDLYMMHFTAQTALIHKRFHNKDTKDQVLAQELDALVTIGHTILHTIDLSEKNREEVMSRIRQLDLLKIKQHYYQLVRQLHRGSDDLEEHDQTEG